MSRRSDQTEFLDSSYVEKAGMRFANDMLRRSGDGDILTTIKQSLEEQLYDGLREGLQKITSPESTDQEKKGDIYTKPNNMMDVIQTGVFELKDKYNSIYNQINKPAKNEGSKDSSSLFERITNPVINAGRRYEQADPIDDIDENGIVDSEELSIAVNGDLGKKLAIVQNDIKNEINKPQTMIPTPQSTDPNATPPNIPDPNKTPDIPDPNKTPNKPQPKPNDPNIPSDKTPVNPMLMKKNTPMSFTPDMETIPEESIYRQMNQVALVTRGLSGHIQSVNLFNRGYPY